jgi:hypothetical protein
MDSANSRLVHAVILLDRQHRLIERLVDRLGPVLGELERKIGTPAASLELVLDAYNYALTLVDSLARYQKIAFSLPRFNYKDPACRALDLALGKIKEARNQLQHINNDIENDNSGPLLGGVGWVSNQIEYLALLNDVGRQRSSPGIAFDTWTDTYTMNFCFTYGDDSYDLGRALQGVRTFNDYVLSRVRIEINGKPYRAEENYMAVRSSFRRVALSPLTDPNQLPPPTSAL